MTNPTLSDPMIKDWNDWLGFAEQVLEYGHEESVEYANVRAVEDENRASLRSAERRDGLRSSGRRFASGLPDEPSSQS